MEKYQQKRGEVLNLKKEPLFQRESDTNPFEECRTLVSMISKKTEILYRECRFDKEKAIHIRAIASALAGLSVLVNRFDQESITPHTQDIFTDARGFTYQTIRFCDLDRISDK
jgi:hypothetical protein